MSRNAPTIDRAGGVPVAEHDHRTVVIAVGNRDRGDDGIAAAVVDRIADQRITTLVCEGESITLPFVWHATDDVVILDACRTGRPLGSLVELDPDDLDDSLVLSTHGCGVAESLALARRLGLLPRRIRLFGIEGRDFDHGPVSAELAAEVPRLARELLARLVGWG